MVFTNPSLQKSSVILIGATAAILAAFGTYFYQRKRKTALPSTWEPVGEVRDLCLYPLKSGRRKHLKTAECTKYGLQQTREDGKVYQLRDRQLIVYNAADGEFRTARTFPHMVLIEVHVDDEKRFVLNAPDMETLYVQMPNPDEAKKLHITHWNSEKIPTLDCGDEAAGWVSRYILKKDSGLRLGFHEGIYTRNLEKAYNKFLKFYKNLTNDFGGLFSDMTSYHLINETSVDLINTKLQNPVSAYNFRPTIVINTSPLAEKAWDWVKIGEVVFRVAKPCTRCMLTTIDPETGIRDVNGEPLKCLKSFQPIENEELRKLERNSPVMGLSMGIKQTGIINVGDTVYVPK